ncbi:MAG: DUF6992 family protein [Saprospiraceae bacterium]
MKYWIIIIGICFLNIGYSQSNLLTFNQERVELSQQSMYVLGGWAVGNIVLSGAMMSQTEGSSYHFHQMNLTWNSVNLAIAGLGYWGVSREKIGDFDLNETIKKQYKIQQVLLFNAGLDIAYMVGGAYLLERAKNDIENKARWTGFGQSLILQGGFLLVFDLIQYGIHAHKNKELKGFLEKNNVSIGLNGIGIRSVF